ncbi:phage holin family protein [Salinibacterium soli]|uniref:Phage holin family protein n=1 Tax=Antiquaquibacter soli TaxID=3064523 RepID=A0ABT9BT31_9MICO|nr:phage holin family protein [Protaetiibacter sp. WY-16]MDO7883567.1 phage holin family protein [Protaetiibacter sp. WY-16]
MTQVPPRPKRSLFTLIGDLPRLLTDLIRGEIEQLKRELIAKAAAAGIGIGLLAVAATFLFFALGVFIAAAILGIATVLPAWAAALIVGGALLVIAIVLVLIGVASLKRSGGGPEETIDSIKKDVRVIKGIGR